MKIVTALFKPNQYGSFLESKKMNIFLSYLLLFSVAAVILAFVSASLIPNQFIKPILSQMPEFRISEGTFEVIGQPNAQLLVAERIYIDTTDNPDMSTFRKHSLSVLITKKALHTHTASQTRVVSFEGKDNITPQTMDDMFARFDEVKQHFIVPLIIGTIAALFLSLLAHAVPVMILIKLLHKEQSLDGIFKLALVSYLPIFFIRSLVFLSPYMISINMFIAWAIGALFVHLGLQNSKENVVIG